MSAPRLLNLRRTIAGRRPARHWLVFGLCLGVIVVMLLIQGVATHTVGASGAGSMGAAASAPLAGSGPVLGLQGARLSSLGSPPPREIALTFDDGPTPQWTPKVVAVLRRYHVPATFFEIGTQVQQHPGISLSLHRQGYEIGDHTFTHVDPATVSRTEANFQIDMAQTAIAGATGIKPRLFRPPYSSSPSAVTPRQAAAYTALARRGYIITLSDYISNDWARPGVAAIVRNAMPPGDRGGIIMFHDGGGNRAETVAALEILIPRLLHRGYRFATVSQLAGLPRAAAEVPATGGQHLRGAVFIDALHLAAWVTRALMLAVLLVGLLTVLRIVAVVCLARRQARRPRSFDPTFTPPVSIVVPAFNEEVGIARAVRSLATSDYPDLEVIVVDDGSTDATREIVDGLRLERVRLLRQPNTGKANALNRGIAAARYDTVVTVDADTVFEPGTLRQLVQPLRNPAVGAVSGNTKVGNRRGLLGRWQHIEYVMGFNLDRRMYEVLRCMPTVPGAIGAFRRDALLAVGGFSGNTLAEDTDITIALARAGWDIVYAPDARAWTEAPATLSGLWRQRYRWAYGTLQSLWKHRDAVWHERGVVGRRTIPYVALFQVALPFVAPFVDLSALYGVLFLNPLPVLGFWLAFNVLQLVPALYAFRLDGESRRPLWAMPLQQFVYRQLMYLVVYESLISAARGIRLRWQHVPRTGYIDVQQQAPGRSS